MKALLIYIALLGGAPLIDAQSINVDLDRVPPITRINLDLSRKVPISLPSNAIHIMPRCREGRCYGLFATDPGHSFAEQIGYFDINGKSSTADLSQLSDLKYVSVLDLAPTEDGLLALIHAEVKQAFGAPNTSDRRGGAWFLARFSKDGEYSGRTRLELDFRPVRMAALPKNRLILSGFDIGTGTALLVTLQDDGTQQQHIDDEGVLPQKEALLKASTLKIDQNSDAGMKAIAMSSVLSGFEFGYAGEEVLFLSSTSAGTSVLSIRGSVIERTKLQMPVGVVGSTVVPTDHGWLVRAFSSQADVALLLEFDRDTGALVRQLDTVPSTNIIFREDDTYYALWSEDGHTYVVSNN